MKITINFLFLQVLPTVFSPCLKSLFLLINVINILTRMLTPVYFGMTRSLP